MMAARKVKAEDVVQAAEAQTSTSATADLTTRLTAVIGPEPAVRAVKALLALESDVLAKRGTQNSTSSIRRLGAKRCIDSILADKALTSEEWTAVGKEMRLALSPQPVS